MEAQLIQKYKNWLKDSDSELSDNSNEDTESEVPRLQPNEILYFPKTFDENNEMKVFENDNFVFYVEKRTHQRRTRFQLEDTLFYLKVKVKNHQNQTQSPLLKDLLSIIDTAFKFILNHLKTFFKKNDKNLCYLTLHQSGLTNGLNTGGFDLQEESNLMVDRLLGMLYQFLTSNQNLELDNTFKVYINVLSIEHSNLNRNNKKKRVRPLNIRRKKVNFLQGKQTKIFFTNYWVIDIPKTLNCGLENIFQNHCLITGVIFGILQHAYNESEFKDKRFLYAQQITSNVQNKQKYAYHIIEQEFVSLSNIINLNENSSFETLAPLLSRHFQCQLFVFSGMEYNSKIKSMYPEIYDDTLKPIFLYEPFNEENHVVFIRHLNSYFRNNLKVCLASKKTFKYVRYQHLCPNKSTCFSCRRFSSNNTYINSLTRVNFCNGNIVEECPFKCLNCNLTLFSQQCYEGHKKLCGKNGHYGFKCTSCNKFYYKSNCASTSAQLKISHKCGDKCCKMCHEMFNSTDAHLCKLKKVNLKNQVYPKLAFFALSFSNSSAGNCYFCFEIRKQYCLQNNIDWDKMLTSLAFPNLYCDIHKNSSLIFEPNMVSIYFENEMGIFDNYLLSFQNVKKQQNVFSYSYSEQLLKQHKKSTKKTFDLQQRLASIKEVENKTTGQNLINLLCDKMWTNTTFICQDSENTILVSKIKKYLKSNC